MVRKSKLLFIITDLGSFENFISELCTILSTNYHLDISVICSKNKVINFEDKFLNQNINFFFVDIPRGLNIIKQLKASIEINRIINNIKPDLIHAHFTTGIFSSILLKNYSNEIWGTFHGLGFAVSKGIRKFIFYLVECLCFSRLDRIILLNKEDFNRIPFNYKTKTVIHKSLGLGCNITLFDRNNYDSKYKKELRAKYSAENSFIIAFTGRFVSFKGFDIVVHTFLKLVQTFPDTFKLLLIGGKDIAHGTGLTFAEEEAIFTHKDVINIGFTNNVNDYLIIADLFFFPSVKEGVPICITESLAMGIPTLTFNSRGCNELVIDAKNGFLVNPSKDKSQNEKEFLDLIVQLCNNPSLLSKFSLAALVDRNQLSRQNFLSESVDLYTSKLDIKIG